MAELLSTNVDVVIDETEGLQKNDTGNTSISIFASLGTPLEVAVSGATSLDDDGTLAFTVSDGDGLTYGFTATATGDTFPSDPEAAFTADGTYVDSGLLTLEGEHIYMFVTDDPTVVVGRTEDGNIVFAVHLEMVEEGGTITGGKLWTAIYEPLFHEDATDADDLSLDLTDKLFVSTSVETGFEGSNVPSGQNLFIMMQGIEDPTKGIVVTGMAPVDQSAGIKITEGDTVNTSKVSDTTFGVNNQMVDKGEGLWFTFITQPVTDYTVPNLTQTEADVEANIQFGGDFGATSATFSVVQLQGGKLATVQITAIDSPDVGGGDTFSNKLATDTADVNGAGTLIAEIVEVSVTISSTLKVTFTDSATISGVKATFNADGSVTLEGIKAGYQIEYTTDGDHNRVLIENATSGKTAFDIGGFAISQTESTSLEVGSQVVFADDGPSIGIVEASYSGTDPDLTTGSDDVTEGASINGTLLADGGADGATSIDIAVGLTAKTLDLTDGASVTFDDPGTAFGTLTVGYTTAGGLTWAFDSDPNSVGETGGTFTFDVTITDADGDTATASHTVNMVDAPATISIDSVAVDEDGIVGGAELAGVGDDETDSADGTPDNDASDIEDRSEATATGTITATTGTVAVTYTSASTALFSGGLAVSTVTVAGTIYFYTGTAPAEGQVPTDVVATLALNEGSYTYTQIAPFDHPETGVSPATSEQDNIVLTFGATIEDANGNTGSTSFTVNVDDDSPELAIGNIQGTGTSDPQIGQWLGVVGADTDGVLSLTMTRYTIGGVLYDTPVVLSSGGTDADGNTVFTGSLDDGTDFSVTFRADGSYVFNLAADFGSTVTVSTADGSLPAGGPDPAQTLTFADPTTNILFFAVNPASTTDEISPFLDLDESGLEAAIAAGPGQTNGVIGADYLMNVSTSGIGVGNNVLQGDNNIAIGSGDESFVVNPVDQDVTSVKVYIDNSVSGYNAPATVAVSSKEALYYTVYYADGSYGPRTLVTASMLTADGQLKYFEIDAAAGQTIDAVQLTMAKGSIKIPYMVLESSDVQVADPITIDFTATLTDKDGDAVSSDFTVALNADDDPLVEPDIVLTGVTAAHDSFNIDLATAYDKWSVTGFEDGLDQIVLTNPLSAYAISASGGDAVITVGATEIVVAGAAGLIAADDIVTAYSNMVVTGTDAFGTAGADHLTAVDGETNALHIIGNDTATGSTGADGFVFAGTGSSGAVIEGFSSDDGDRFIISAQGFGLDLPEGVLASDAFATQLDVADAEDRFYYNTATGALYFDADGTGASAAVQIATLAGAPVLSADDFLIIG